MNNLNPMPIQKTETVAASEITRDTTPLRFITCGSVDDGKSTLIGRLLWDTKTVFDDQIEATSKNSGNDQLDLPDFANLLDGLQAEREQGITIDVAYRYFSTQRRSFIVADTPGHKQYTRNMATGASNADLAVLLVDARAGILEQTRRHATIVSLMGIRQIVLVVNKIDLVDYQESSFNSAVTQFTNFAKEFNFQSITTIPVSAINGENVASQAQHKMPWYKGPTLLETLELATKPAASSVGFRLPVQRVCRPDESFRGYQGTVAGGAIKPGDSVTILPSGETANVKKIITFDLVRNAGVSGDAITLELDRQIDISRGDMITSHDAKPHVSDTFDAHLIVLSNKGLQTQKRYWLKTGSRRQHVFIDPKTSLNLETGEWEENDNLSVNMIADIQLKFEAVAIFDTYRQNRITGSFILIDPDTNETVAAGMINAVASHVVPFKNPDSETLTLFSLPQQLVEKFIKTDFYKENSIHIQSAEISEFEMKTLLKKQNKQQK
ncbi:sulfate adenylyltransferase subunit CysN [Lentilitoribacter sp. Alg239-R112]|uniref:sulfate adenylyltransferase subunit CysN n=1 Tax=Lentilitoribacter sp. Alg239-R112 TaxID=2305987 RepID=UPI0013A6C906|nr:sulfate adenylyltransferase subunit CysN [Lentilitoribacter sp. Alg239-R112]